MRLTAIVFAWWFLWGSQQMGPFASEKVCGEVRGYIALTYGGKSSPCWDGGDWPMPAPR